MYKIYIIQNIRKKIYALYKKIVNICLIVSIFNYSYENRGRERELYIYEIIQFYNLLSLASSGQISAISLYAFEM